MSSEALTPCPFCGGEARLTTSVTAPPNSYCQSMTHVLVSCCHCGATSGGLKVSTFSNFTPYTVQAFRDDVGLRRREKVRYEEYEESLVTTAKQNWNIRFTNNNKEPSNE